jgi:hypothetical protein
LALSSFRFVSVAALLVVAASCSKAPVPSGVFLSLSVSSADVAVSTRVNGEINEHLSGHGDGIVASGPVNKALKPGANEIAFTLSYTGEQDEQTLDPWFLAALEIGVKGEAVEEEDAPQRQIFQRELRPREIKALLAGSDVVITESFEISRDQLKELKANATMAPKSEPAEAGHH